MLSLEINRHNAGQRLDRFLRKAFPEAPLGFIFAILRKKKVRVNGAIGKAAQKLNESDEVKIYENLPQAATFTEQKTQAASAINEIEFVMQTDEFAVINKPYGLPSQSGTGIKEENSLAGMLGIWAREEGLDFKPALVHRLDRDTSGLMLTALSGYAVRELSCFIKNRKIRKEYLALVKGHAEKKGRVRKALPGEARISETSWVVEESFEECDLVRVSIETGRKHQIRIVFAEMGNPLAGDKKYGDFKFNRDIKEKTGLSRLFLHASLLEFMWKGEDIRLESKLPPSLEKALAKL